MNREDIAHEIALDLLEVDMRWTDAITAMTITRL